MSFVPNTQTEQFWHPVMGAVDLITGQVIENRRAKRQERLRQQMLSDQRTLEDERYGREVKGKRFQGMLGIYQSMLNDKDVEPAEKTKLLKGMTDLVNAGPDATMTAPQAPAQMVRPLREDVAKAFGSVIPVGKQLPYDMALKIEQEYDVQKASMINANARQTSANNRGPVDLQGKTLNQLRLLRQAYSPKFMKVSDESGQETIQEVGGDPAVVAEIDAKIAEMTGLDKTEEPPKSATMSDIGNQVLAPGANQALSAGILDIPYMMRGNPTGGKSLTMGELSGTKEEPMDASMKALIEEMRQIRKEAQKLK